MKTDSLSNFQIKITLQNAEPAIWRRMLVPSKMKLSDLHLSIQIAMGWANSHLHQFIKNGEYYGMSAFDDEVQDESKFGIDHFLKTKGDSIVYEYDFGDSWQHEIKLEEIINVDNQALVPVCLQGERACPLEDTGGVWGYEDLLKSLSDPKHPNHEDTVDWLGEDFDAEEFDLHVTNKEFANFREGKVVLFG